MLARAGLDVAALRCGAHPPIHQPSAAALYRAGAAPSALHNNCSGKHAGFLCVACALGADPQGYVEPSHPVQREVKAAIEGVSAATISDDLRAVDGCSAPTWAVPLKSLALAFARLGTGHGLAPQRAKAAARLRAACAAHPWHVAGTGRFCTEIMRLFGARVFVKTGAEGVFCAAFPDAGPRRRGEMRGRRDARRRGGDGGVDRALLCLERARSARGLERFLRPTHAQLERRSRSAACGRPKALTAVSARGCR